MESWSSIFTLLALIFFLIHIPALFISTKTKKGKKNLLPSPPSLPIIGHLHQLKKPLHQSLARLSARHGPLLRLRFGIRPALLVSSYSLAEECLTINDLAFANRSKFPSSRLPTYNHTLIPSASYGPEWRDMRRIASLEAFSAHRLAFFSGIRANEAGALARNLFSDTVNEAGEEFTRVELKTRLFGLAMNVMMGVIDGKRYYGEDGGMDGEMHRFKEAVEEGFKLAGGSNAGDFLPAVIGWVAGRRVKRVVAGIHERKDGFIQSIVDRKRRERGAGERSNRTLIDALLLLQEQQPEQYTDRFIKALVSVSLLRNLSTGPHSLIILRAILLLLTSY